MDIKKINQQTRDNYNIVAKHFSQTRQFLWQELKPFLTYINPNDKVLDVGCGNGRLFGAINSLNPTININYLGIDFSQELLSLAKKDYSQAKFILADITDKNTWANLKNSDIAFCIAMFHHLPTRSLQFKVLRLIRKSLKKNGLLVISVWNLWQKKYWQTHLDSLNWKLKSGFKLRWLKLPYKISDGKTTIKQVNRFCYCFTLNELDNLLTKAGFKILDKKSGKNLCLLAKKC